MDGLVRNYARNSITGARRKNRAREISSIRLCAEPGDPGAAWGSLLWLPDAGLLSYQLMPIAIALYEQLRC